MSELPRPLPEQPIGDGRIETKAESIEVVAREQPELETPLQPVLPAQIAPQTKAPQLRAVPPLQRSIESVLQDGLESIYRELNPVEQAQFRARGEAAASQISLLLQRVTVKVAEILKLIRQWLMTIPGINRYYLEQAAKIKADRILKLR